MTSVGIAVAGCGGESRPAPPAPSTGVVKPMRKSGPKAPLALTGSGGPAGSGFGIKTGVEGSPSDEPRPVRTMAPELEDLDEALDGGAAPAGPRERWQCPVCATETAAAGRCCGRDRVQLK